MVDIECLPLEKLLEYNLYQIHSELAGSRTTNYKALENAVAPVMMWKITQEIIKALNGEA